MKTILLTLFLSTCSLSAIAQSLSGKIVSDQDEPIANATVHLLNTNITVFTDSSGRFVLPRMDVGSYVAIIHAAGLADKLYEIEVQEGEDTLPTIMLSPEYKALGQAFVSVEKKEQSLASTALSVSVISSNQVNLFQLRNSKEITAIVPNLYSANPGDNRNVTSVRGIVSSSYDPAVTTYIDGVNQFNLDTYIAELLDIERIEVLRGPQGTLYGRNAMGGVINILTNEPVDRISGFAQASIGNYGFQRLDAAINIPLIKNKLMLRLAGDYDHLDGYYINKFNNSHYDQQHSTMLAPDIKYRVDDHWSIQLNAKMQFNRNNGAFALNYKESALADPFDLNQNAVATMVDNICDVALNLNYAGTGFNFTSVTSYQKNYRYYQNAIDADFSDLDAISIYNNYGSSWNFDDVITQEFRFNSPSRQTSRLAWTAGSYLFYQKTPVKQSTIFGKDAKQAGIPDSLFSIENSSKGTSNGQALFGQVSLHVSNKVQVIAGLRYDHEYKTLAVASNYHKQNNSFPIISDTSSNAQFNVLSPKIGLLYKIASRTTLFVNYSRGFRSGGLTQLSSDPSQPPLFHFEPEFSNNVEIGFKSRPINNVQFDLTVFYTTINHAQIPVLILPDAITVTKNAGLVRSVGFESEIAAQLIRGLRINYNFGLTNAVFKESMASQGGQQINIEGNYQIFTPALTSFLNVQYRHKINVTKKLFFEISGQWSYIGKQYFDIANTIAQPGYNVININAGIGLKDLRFVLWAKNFTDTRYIDYAYDFGAAHLGNPATLGCTLGVTF
jgi:iron complex outermembrane recepter protein